ncbi:MAG TPA: glycosyltransferase family 9 protein [Drouetiella sp.]|jgi:ADP-heptose:LPS heptosyltransferase
MIPRLHKSNKILAINFGGIGDEVLFLPTLKTLREAYPKAHITLLLEPRSRSIEQITNLIDATITFDIKKRPLFLGDIAELVRLIQDGDYELALSSGSSKMVSILLFLGGSNWRIGYDSGPLSRLLLTHPVKLNREQYASDMYHDLAVELVPSAARNGSTTVPEIHIPQENMARMEEFLRSSDTKSGAKKILLHPGTSRLAVEKGIIKTWEINDWIALINKLDRDPDCQPILAGGPDDTEIIKEIQANLPSTTKLISSAGKTKSLADLAALTKLCDVLVCVDSAPMHIAVGARKPVVAMFGPTDEAKLLPKDPQFVAMRAATASQPTLAVRGVQLPPDDVYQSVQCLLRESKDQGSSLALHH